MEAPTIETDRLMIRPFSVSDVDGFVTELTSDPEIMKNLSEECGTPAAQKECATLYIQGYSSTWQPHHYGGWAVCDRGGDITKRGKLLGFCGFGSGQIDDAGPELAFAYGRSHWGKGVATEAARACLDWFFHQGGHDRCYVCHHTWNNASKKVIDKFGFAYSRDEDLWGSLEKGHGLLPTYLLDRTTYVKTRSPF